MALAHAAYILQNFRVATSIASDPPRAISRKMMAGERSFNARSAGGALVK
jgi:hypothetical protein